MRVLDGWSVDRGFVRDPDAGAYWEMALPASRFVRLDRCMVRCSAQGDVRQPGRHSTLHDEARVSPVALRPRLSPGLPLSRTYHHRLVRSCRSIVGTSVRRAELIRVTRRRCRCPVSLDSTLGMVLHMTVEDHTLLGRRRSRSRASRLSWCTPAHATHNAKGGEPGLAAFVIATAVDVRPQNFVISSYAFLKSST
jgi:hypothetical protein